MMKELSDVSKTAPCFYRARNRSKRDDFHHELKILGPRNIFRPIFGQLISDCGDMCEKSTLLMLAIIAVTRPKTLMFKGKAPALPVNSLHLSSQWTNLGTHRSVDQNKSGGNPCT